MGLDTTHACWHGSYSGFKVFRDAVARAAEIANGYVPDYENHPNRAVMGWWDNDHPYGDVLDVFFVHSDCEGYIFPRDANKLIPALTALLPHVEGDYYPGVTYQSKLTTFIAGLQAAADEWQIVEFH